MLVPVTNGGSVNEGRLLDGRYRLGAVLGTGGVAEVYRARDERLERSVAVKLFRGDVEQSCTGTRTRCARSPVSTTPRS